MNQISIQQFAKMCHCSEQTANVWLPPLMKAMELCQIDTPIEQAGFLAQLTHESGSFKFVRENLNYSAEGLRKVFGKYFPTDALAAQYARKPEKIANRVYANRMGNGDEASGDGWNYRGGCPIQLTGKNNYIKYGNILGIDLVKNPERIVDAEVGSLISCYFWKNNGLNEIVDDDDNMNAETKKINGGVNGLADREKLFDANCVILGIKFVNGKPIT